jgi:cytidyltransferase-like protein
MNLEMEKNIMLFGSFDGLHQGHEFIINKAKEIGKNLFVVVAQDITILNIKSRSPVSNIKTRIHQLSEIYSEITILPGDNVLGTWSPIKKYQPHIIVVGYDQNGLKNALEKIQDIYDFQIVQLGSFHPNKYKSSLLRKK